MKHSSTTSRLSTETSFVNSLPTPVCACSSTQCIIPGQPAPYSPHASIPSHALNSSHWPAPARSIRTAALALLHALRLDLLPLLDMHVPRLKPLFVPPNSWTQAGQDASFICCKPCVFVQQHHPCTLPHLAQVVQVVTAGGAARTGGWV